VQINQVGVIEIVSENKKNKTKLGHAGVGPQGAVNNLESSSNPNKLIPTSGAIWNLGFRPFYLFGSAWASLAMLLWMAQWTGYVQLTSHLNGVAWHMHEMVFGYAFAIVVGFLFTAVQNWTVKPTPKGLQLALVLCAWLAARVLYLTSWSVYGIVFETLFFALAAIGISIPMLQSKNWHNLLFVVLITFVAAINLVFHGIVLGKVSVVSLQTITVLGLDILAFMVTAITGRTLPMFTRNGAPGSQPRSFPWLEKSCLVSVLLVGGLSAASLSGEWVYLTVAVMLVTSGLLLLRWILCAPQASWRNPLLWILHASIIWLPLGFMLRATALVSDVLPLSLGIHAITVGVIGGLTLAMMTRTARGHTGRELRASKLETLAYVCIILSVLIRVLVPLAIPTFYAVSIYLSAFFWIIAFSLYVWVFTPWLMAPRIDGKVG